MLNPAAQMPYFTASCWFRCDTGCAFIHCKWAVKSRTWSPHTHGCMAKMRGHLSSWLAEVQVTVEFRWKTNQQNSSEDLWRRKPLYGGISEVYRQERGKKWEKALLSETVKIIIRKPGYNLFWIDFYYNVAPCDECLGCQKLASRLKWALK